MSEKEYYALLIRWISRANVDLYWFQTHAPNDAFTNKFLGISRHLKTLQSSAEYYSATVRDFPHFGKEEQDDEPGNV